MTVLIIALNDFRRVFRERQNLFWIFAAPLMFVVFFGLMLQPSAPRATVLSIVDQDAPGTAASELSRALNADGIETRMVSTAPKSGFSAIVPKGTSDALAAGTKVQIVLKAGADPTDQERRLQFKILKALLGLTLDGGKSAAAAAGPGPLSVTLASLGVHRQPRGFQYSIPAYLVMFAFMNLLVSGAGLAEERASGRLRRLAMAPVTFNQIVLGKLLVRVATGWLQMAYLLGLGVFVFHIEWGGNPLTLFGFLSVLALAAGALGILVGTAFDDPDKCANLAVWSVMILSPLGGLWWPLEIVGPTLKKVADVIPTGWAMQGVNAIMAFGAGPLDVAPFAAALLALFVISFALAARRLRRQVMHA